MNARSNQLALLDPASCPVCGRANQCANEIERQTGVAQDACWCVGASFSHDLLQRVPQELRNKACICATCADHERNP